MQLQLWFTSSPGDRPLLFGATALYKRKTKFPPAALGGCALLSFKNDTSPTLGLTDATVHIPAVRMPRYSIWLSSPEDLAQHPRFVFSLDSLAAGRAEVSGGLEGGGVGKCSCSSTVAVSIPSGKGMTISAPGFPLLWPLPVSLLPRPLWQGSWWHCSRCVGYLLAVCWWWLIRQRPRLDLGRKQRNYRYLHRCSRSHPFCVPCRAGFGDQQRAHPECLETTGPKPLQDQERQNINVVGFLLLFIYFVLRSRAASFQSVNCLQCGQSFFCTSPERAIHPYFGSVPQKRVSRLSREESGLILDCLSAMLFFVLSTPFAPCLILHHSC